jgi:hypothetical protein
MNTLRHTLAFLIDLAFVLLMGSALAVIASVMIRLVTAPFAGAWLALAFRIGLTAFVWMLPLTLVVILLGQAFAPVRVVGPSGREEHTNE